MLLLLLYGFFGKQVIQFYGAIDGDDVAKAKAEDEKKTSEPTNHHICTIFTAYHTQSK